MRQAGRYLPEYRAIRAHGPFVPRSLPRPELAAEVTLQPIRRFDFDAAILFSDILVVPDALRPKRARSSKAKGRGSIPSMRDGYRSARCSSRSTRTPRAGLRDGARVRGNSRPEKALIGFCGAPWTVATYMIAGQGTPDQAPARLMAAREPGAFQALDRHAGRSLGRPISPASSGRRRRRPDLRQLGRQSSTRTDFERWCDRADGGRSSSGVAAAARRCRSSAFPRAPALRLERYVEATGVDARRDRLDRAARSCAGTAAAAVAVQGNLDPLRLVAGGEALDAGSRCASSTGLAGGRFIFNLGHGIMPETPIAHVERAASDGVRRGVDHDGLARDRLSSGSRRSTSSPSSPGWRGCSICRGCSSITPTPHRARSSPRPSRSWSGGCCAAS